MCIITADFSFDGFRILPRANSLCAIIKFHDKVECITAWRYQVKRTIRVHREAVDSQSNTVFSGEMTDENTALGSRDSKMHDEFRQGIRMMVMTVADLFEVSSTRQGGINAVQ
jgi:hypothetical protein